MWKRTFSISTSGLVVLLLVSITITIVRASSLRPADCGGETKSPDFQICVPPPCTEDQINTLWPTEDRNYFYQCAPQSRCSWYPVRMPCAPGTVFGFKEQVCIWECDWVDPCNGTLSTTSSTTSSSSTTGSSSTTEKTTSGEPTTEDTTPETSTKEGETTTEPPICEIPFCTNNEVDKLWPVQGYPESYYQCNPNPKGKCEYMVVQKLCPNGYYFDFKQQDCVDPKNWVDVCSPEPTTTENVTTESTTAISTSETTEQSTITSTSEETTTEPSTTSTESGIECVIPDCSKPQRHLLWPVSDSPESFYQCQAVNGSDCKYEPVLKKCPDGGWFDGRQQECVKPELWKESCSERTTGSETTTEIYSTTNAQTTTTTKPDFELCEEPTCLDGQTDTLWPHINPRQYYQCQPVPGNGFEAEVVTCENNLYFSYDKQDCVPYSDWKNICPSPTTTDAPTTEISTTEISTTEAPTTEISTTVISSTEISTTEQPTTEISTTEISTTDQSTTEASTTEVPTTEVSTTEVSTTEAPTTEPSTTESPTTEERTTDGPGEVTSVIPTSTTPDPGYVFCQTPKCTEDQRQKLWPNQIPSVYYRCVPAANGEWTSQTLNCLRGTYFDFKKQQCVDPTEWEDVCPAPGSEGQSYCIQPECKTDTGKSQLWPHPDRKYFYQCAPSKECGFAPVKMPCAQSLVFSYQQQVCVEPCDWVDPCTNSTTQAPVGTTSTRTTGKPTTRATTTKKPTTRSTSTTTRTTTTRKVTPTKPTYRPTTTTTRPTTRSTTRPTTWSTTRSTTTTPKPSPSTSGPPPDRGEPGETCIPPKCDTDFERLRLYPHPNKNFYYQCAPDANRVPEYTPIERPCGPGTAFSWRYQVCVHERDWEDPCESAQNEITNAERRVGSGKRGPMYLPPRFK